MLKYLQKNGGDITSTVITNLYRITQQNATFVQEAEVNAITLERDAGRLNDTIALFGSGNVPKSPVT